VGQERLGPSYFFIPLVLGPLNSLVWYVPSLRYTRGLGWRMHCGAEVTESSTNKQHHLSTRTHCVSVGGLHVSACQAYQGAEGQQQELYVCVFVCVFITAVPNTNLCAWGEEDCGGHVL
jgi:hypothetical protein